MKKALMKVILTVMTLVTLLTVIPLSAQASTSNKKEVFSYLTQELGFNSAAACGIMANIEKESNFKPTCVIRDSNGLFSGGLCQWNGSRLTSLKNFCSKNGYNYLSIKGQLEYLEYELKQAYYNHIYKYLKNVPNSASGAYDAAYYWCYYFEIPANRVSRAHQRANTASGSYWKTYGNKNVEKPELSFSGKKDEFDISTSFTLKWTSGGKYADTYKVFVAEKNAKTGKYDWDNAKIYNTEALKQKINTGYFGVGTFRVFVRAINNTTGSYKDSNYLTFTIDCLSHEYKTQVIKTPTLTEGGASRLTCKQCGKTVNKTLDKLTLETLGDYPMSDIKSTTQTRTDDSIGLTWEKYEGADGYYVYQKIDDKWTLIDIVSETSYTVKNLKPSTEYKFAVRAYVKQDDQLYRTYSSAIHTTSTETKPVKLVSAVSTKKDKATLKWERNKNATGYAIYISENGQDFEKAAMIKGNKNLSYTFDDLKSGKTYYFRVHTYISVPTHNVYNAASNVISVKIK